MANVIDVIKYEGDNRTFIQKYPCEDFNTGSQLIVHESQEAVFFRDGKVSARADTRAKLRICPDEKIILTQSRAVSRYSTPKSTL